LGGLGSILVARMSNNYITMYFFFILVCCYQLKYFAFDPSCYFQIWVHIKSWFSMTQCSEQSCTLLFYNQTHEFFFLFFRVRSSIFKEWPRNWSYYDHLWL